ncbi:response regulator transcription factor [Microbacterium sp. HD4P20]|uniref:response regulator n=1 Tax=Microbacterium sp. HD4P20 TaxID=2864874 RepID=UPI001C643411|nr:response regulator transcription factor [Microbacterium sp. HD4P20]MCP2638281.1 response regulator transcription factor [Microbacterium sp. HD4P20]
MTAPLRVLVVDDQHLVREGIRSLLGLSQEIEVVGDCADGNEALQFMTAGMADVVLLDLRMPGLDGIATLDAMRARGLDIPVLVLTTFDDDELVLSALESGAKGYMLKDVTLDQLLGGIRTVAAGGTLLQPALTDRLLRAVARYPHETARGPRLEDLTDRERDVLRLAASGWSNRQIAKGLFLAEGTVKNHMSSVLMKLDVTDRTRAVLRALELGILTPGENSSTEGGDRDA